MKQAISTLFFIIVLVMMAIQPQTMMADDMRIMVISDTHVVAEANQATVKNESGKLDNLSRDILAKALVNIKEVKPDLLLVSGDLTYNGEKTGHECAHELLATVKEAGIPVLVIPGNHDILNINSIDEGKASITADEFAALYADMGYGADVARDEKSLSWAVSINDKLALIGLDSNIYSQSMYNGGMHIGDGCLRKSTLDWMKAQAAAFQKEGKMVIAMVHHEIMNHFTKDVTYMGITKTVSQIDYMKSTILNLDYTHNPVDNEEDVSNEEVQKAFADAGIKYVLTGHFHIHNIATSNITKSDGTTAELHDVSTGGLTTYPCYMRTLLVDEDAQTLTSTSSFVEMPLEDYKSNLQKAAKEESKELDVRYLAVIKKQLEEQYPSWSSMIYNAIVASGFSISELIDEQMINEPYELYDGTEVAQYEGDGQKSYPFPSLSYTRTFTDNTWQPFYVPFTSKYSDWSDDFDIALPDQSATDYLHFTTLDETLEIPANTLALIRLKSGKTPGRYSVSASPLDNVVNLSPADCEVVIAGSKMVGTYRGLTDTEMQAGGYYALGERQLDKVTSSEGIVFVKPMRWYLDADESKSSLLTIPVYVDDEKETVNCDVNNDGVVDILDVTSVISKFLNGTAGTESVTNVVNSVLKKK